MTGIAEQLKTDAAVADERRGLMPAPFRRRSLRLRWRCWSST